jgi:glutamine amidotransferase
MLAIVDYGVGNLYSLSSSLKCVGVEQVIATEPEQLRKADHIILPGVGAFEDAARKLAQSGMRETVLEEAAKGKPLLGICLGMQMLFEKSYEYGEHKGLGLIPGKVISMEGIVPSDYKIPHIGWNALRFKQDCPIFKDINEGDCVYFVHSYFATDCAPYVTATAEYGPELTAAVAYKNVFGCQFHPEKSGAVGLSILKAFTELKEEDLC